jgi:hypothetical protein
LFSDLLVDMKKILELDPSNDQAKKTIRRLQPLAEEKREKMKEEMIGKYSKEVFFLFFLRIVLQAAQIFESS